MSARYPAFPTYPGYQKITNPLPMPGVAPGSTIFTVTGVILITALIGLVTTAITGTATTLNVSAGGGTMFSATLNPVPAGTFICGGSTVSQCAQFNSQPFPAEPFIFNDINPVGAANIWWDVNAATLAGAVAWFLWYLPLVAGSEVS